MERSEAEKRMRNFDRPSMSFRKHDGRWVVYAGLVPASTTIQVGDVLVVPTRAGIEKVVRLTAIVDWAKCLYDFEDVQEAPVGKERAKDQGGETESSDQGGEI